MAICSLNVKPTNFVEVIAQYPRLKVWLNRPFPSNLFARQNDALRKAAQRVRALKTRVTEKGLLSQSPAGNTQSTNRPAKRERDEQSDAADVSGARKRSRRDEEDDTAQGAFTEIHETSNLHDAQEQATGCRPHHEFVSAYTVKTSDLKVCVFNCVASGCKMTRKIIQQPSGAFLVQETTMGHLNGHAPVKRKKYPWSRAQTDALQEYWTLHPDANAAAGLRHLKKHNLLNGCMPQYVKSWMRKFKHVQRGKMPKVELQE